MESCGEEDIVSGHSFVSGDDVAVGESSHVSNVEISRYARVRKVDKEFLFVCVLCFVDLFSYPVLLPFFFYCLIIVVFLFHSGFLVGNDKCFI